MNRDFNIPIRNFNLLLLGLLLVMFVGGSVVSTSAQHASNAAQSAPGDFLGEVEYQVTASGSNKEGVAAFKAFSPTNIKVIFGQQGFRLIETGGAGNNVLLNYGTGEAHFLDPVAKTATKTNYGNLDDEDAGKMASILPFHYRTDMQRTGKTATIGGQSCREYKVIKSAFVRTGATASIWIAEGINFKRSRYSFQNESSRADSPLPLSVAIPKGAILRMVINESGVSAVYEAVRLTPGSQQEAAMFTVPADYKLIAEK